MKPLARFMVTLTVAFVAGMAPVLLWLGSIRIGSDWLVGMAAVIGLALSALGTWAGREEIGSERRRWWEFVAAGASAASNIAVFGVFAALVYLAAHWVVRGLNAMFDTSLSGETIPFWTALVVIYVFAALMWVVIPRSSIRRMYPRHGAAESQYASVLRKVDSDLWRYGLPGSALIAGAAAFVPFANAWFVAATLLLVLGGYAVTPRERIETEPTLDAVTAAVTEAQAAFEKAGFSCIAYPRTGVSEVDTALESLHLVASDAECTVAVEVLIGQKATTFGSSQVSAVVVAAWALTEQLDGVDRVWPMVISKGARPEPEATDYARRRQVTLLAPEHTGIIHVGPHQRLEQVAQQLGYRATAAAPAEEVA